MSGFGKVTADDSHIFISVSCRNIYLSFRFAQVDRSIVCVDRDGKPIGKAYVEFHQRAAAWLCWQFINSGIFYMTAILQPLSVERTIYRDHEFLSVGLPEKKLLKSLRGDMEEYKQQRARAPLFAEYGSIEYNIGKDANAFFRSQNGKRAAFQRKYTTDLANKNAEYKRKLTILGRAADNQSVSI
jgi:hypothetical protein